MNRLHELIKTAEFKGFCYGVLACFGSIFVAAAATSSAITFTASNAIVLTPVKCQLYVPACPRCPDQKADHLPSVPATPVVPDHKKKKGDLGAIGAVSAVSLQLDCNDGCKCGGRGGEGCVCITLAAVKCPCQNCPCDAGACCKK